METIDWFRFEDTDRDFPIYKKNPHIPKWGWIVLFILLPIGLILSMSTKIPIAILSCLVLVVPVLYFLKWDYKAIFQKPKLKDIALAVGLFVGYMLYALIATTLLETVSISGGTLVEPSTITIMTTIPVIFSLITEEFVKFIPFIFFLRVFYKYSNNRKLSVIISVGLVMVFFASLHAYTFNMFLYALCIQGFGSIFEYIGYIKTKNILVSYITHLCTDMFVYAIILLGL